jgi:hypothetical protein
MINFYCGKPGNGKSMRATHDIIMELVYGERVIVTNVALKLPEIWLGIQKKFPVQFERKFLNQTRNHIEDWIILLGDDQVNHFFTIRNNKGKIYEPITKESWRGGKRPDYKGVEDAGVFYVLDEVHVSFAARNWAETGQEVLYYLSQHRKLGDSVLCITQAVDNVDKQFRTVAQEFWYFKHLAKTRLSGFRLPNRFIYMVYPCAVHSGSAMKPLEMGTFSLDVKFLGQCYDTRKGVGIAGKARADMQHRLKGWDYKWLAIPALILFLLLLWGPRHYINSLTSHKFDGSAVKPVAAPQIHSINVAPFFSSLSRTNVSVVTDTNADAVSDLPEVVCTGFCQVSSNQMMAFLSDGSILYSSDIKAVRARKIWTWDGNVYPIDNYAQLSALGYIKVVSREPSQPSGLSIPPSRFSPSDYSSTMAIVPRDHRTIPSAGDQFQQQAFGSNSRSINSSYGSTP